ncbi:PREDICTED: uncharacterized protein LOC102003103 [Chinchilla lanigera]|uniref:uncharacterized protein LOC102003103 n=1 Tax=Chinchilla lanigera TaxID=34839 RepID=UPI00038EF743|nr:PREDICTED: uncharacterized protein LOC102003103 [Chinchilla lanigera]
MAVAAPLRCPAVVDSGRGTPPAVARSSQVLPSRCPQRHLLPSTHCSASLPSVSPPAPASATPGPGRNRPLSLNSLSSPWGLKTKTVEDGDVKPEDQKCWGEELRRRPGGRLRCNGIQVTGGGEGKERGRPRPLRLQKGNQVREEGRQVGVGRAVRCVRWESGAGRCAVMAGARAARERPLLSGETPKKPQNGAASGWSAGVLLQECWSAAMGAGAAKGRGQDHL